MLSHVDPAAFDVVLVEVQDHAPAHVAAIDRLLVAAGLARARKLWVPKSRVYLGGAVTERAPPHDSTVNRRGHYSQRFDRASSGTDGAPPSGAG